MFAQTLTKIINKTDLTQSEMAEILSAIFSGKMTEAQIGAFMAALATKGETFEELAGAAGAMRKHATRLQTTAPIVVDTCGTGGDGAKTFNISTTAALVVAGAGVTVAKHGNRSISSKCGSADVLEALGVKLDIESEIVEEAINEINIGFMFAPLFHGAMKYAAVPRKELGVRTVFNMLGPLTNPAAANCQVIGVFAPELTEMFAAALNLLGSQRAFVVHGHDGLDEISVCAPTRISELKEGVVTTYDISPEQFFDEIAGPKEMVGGNPEENAQITKDILSGKDTGPKRDVVAINAGAALLAAGQAADLTDGITLANNIIANGQALEKLNQLVEFTNSNG